MYEKRMVFREKLYKKEKKQVPNLIVIFISSLIAVLIVRAFEIAIKKIIRAVKNGKNKG